VNKLIDPQGRNAFCCRKKGPPRLGGRKKKTSREKTDYCVKRHRRGGGWIRKSENNEIKRKQFFISDRGKCQGG